LQVGVGAAESCQSPCPGRPVCSAAR